MTLQEILRVKGSTVYTIAPTATLAEVVQSLVRHKCGSLVVCDPPEPGRNPRMAGIITERDILRACAEHTDGLGRLLASDYMSADVVTGLPSHSVDHIMGVMTDHRVRHLPVLEDGLLVGLISIGDVVKAHYHQAVVENHYLKSYISS
jgi:CBS domain-containing protein